MKKKNMMYSYDESTMKFIPEISYNSLVFYFISTILLSMVLTAGLSMVMIARYELDQEIAEDVEMELMIIDILSDDSVDRDKLLKYIKKCGIMHPDIVLAQAILESDLKSDLFMENNNLFGMKLAKQRPTTASGSLNGYAYYKTWRESVQDYALFQAAYMRKLKTKEKYFEYLAQSYAEDPEYVSKIKNIISKL